MPQIVDCNLCGAQSAQPLHEMACYLNLDPPYALCRCDRCGLGYLNPQPTLSELCALYASHPYYSADNATRGFARRRFYQKRLARLERWRSHPGSMLSIGCLAGGYVLDVARRRGWRVEAVESSAILAAHARGLGVDVEVSPGWDLAPVSGRIYDAVHCHSLEHVLAPRRTLTEAREVLRPGGLLLLEVPNAFASLKEILKMAAFRYGPPLLDRWMFREDLTLFHTYYFDPSTLRQLVQETGFEVLALRTYLPNHPVYVGTGARRPLRELVHAVGGPLGRGPSIELNARAS